MLTRKYRKSLLGASISLIMAAQAQGIEFYAGGLEGAWDNQVSMGSSWRVENPDQVLLSDPNGNNGNANYDKNDAFSQVFKGSSELQANYENVGMFVRAKYWYDVALENDDNLDDSQYDDLAKFSGAEVFDAFVYGEFEVLDMPVDVRLGKQAVSWGESSFIMGGVNEINGYDVSAFNRPGAKIKEAVIPVNMAFANIGLSESLSVEAFYQLENRQTVLDACGTYFSELDYASQGCDDIDTGLGVSIRQDADFARTPSSDGQFGVALRFISDALDTEFGLYTMNIHSRAPLLSTINAGFNDLAALTEPAVQAEIQGMSNYLANGVNPFDSTAYDALVAAATAGDATAQGMLAELSLLASVGVLAGKNLAQTTFLTEFPEDIQIVGLSFATTLAGVAVSGEVSHRFDQPIQYNSEISLEAIAQTGAVAALAEVGALGAVTKEQAVLSLVGDLGLEELATADGEISHGYRTFDVSQLQVTAIKLFDPMLGASSVWAMAEAALTHVHGFDENDSVKFGGIGIYDAVTEERIGFEDTMTENAWGYRALVGADFANVFAGVSLSPEIFWSQDVDGASSSHVSAFTEGNESLGLTLSASYLNAYNASVSYTQFSGGPYHYSADRDFVSIDVGMQF